MGQVVTVMNMKGGVGKTTVCMHLGGLLGRYKIPSNHNKVLLIDYDPQFNLSQAMLRSGRYFELESKGQTCLQILQDTETGLDPFEIQTPDSAKPPQITEIAETLVATKAGAKVDIVPSTLDLMYIALGTATGDVEVIEARFEKFVRDCRNQYDLARIIHQRADFGVADVA